MGRCISLLAFAAHPTSRRRNCILISQRTDQSLPGCPTLICSRVMLSRASSTLPSLLDPTSQVSADAFSPLNYCTAAVHRLVAGEAGNHVRLALPTHLLISCRLENIMCATAMGVVGIWCMHFIGYVSRKTAPYSTPDFSTATALLALAMDGIHYSLSMLPVLQHSLCSCL